jgi:hypothetical protein
MPPEEFKPAIPGSKRPQTHALDRAATSIGSSFVRIVKFWRYIYIYIYIFNFGGETAILST